MIDSLSKRNSNFELMRIISMLMIILWHVIMHGNILNNCPRESLNIVFYFLQFLLVVHVNSFVMVSGYFQSTLKFKMSKFIKNVNLCWFYRIFILITLIILRVWQPTNLEIFQNIFIFDLNVYWFMDIFIFLYGISPFLNKLLEKFNRLDFKKFLIVLFILFSIVPYVTGHKAYSNSGYTLCNFIFIYSIGAYLRQYSFFENEKLKKYSKSKIRLILLISFLILGTINFVITKSSFKLTPNNAFLTEYANYIIYSSLLYSNPIVILQTVSYFLFFQSLSFQNKFINKISSLVIGVYLIHDHPVIRGNLYHWLKIDGRVIYSFKFIFYVAFCVILIFVVCAFIEWLRQVLFKFIANLKISKWWRKTYREQIDKLGLEISW